MRIDRRFSMWSVGIVCMGLVLSAAAAWACVAGPTLLAMPQTVAAGSGVQIGGISYSEGLPVSVRLGGLDGPVLGEFTVNEGGRLSGSVTIPSGTQPGSRILVATQRTPDGDLGIIPTRALVSVTGEGGAPVLGAPLAETPTSRTPALAESEPLSTMALVLAGVGVGGVALFLAGMVVVVGGRRPRPEAESARLK